MASEVFKLLSLTLISVIISRYFELVLICLLLESSVCISSCAALLKLLELLDVGQRWYTKGGKAVSR